MSMACQVIRGVSFYESACMDKGRDKPGPHIVANKPF